MLVIACLNIPATLILLATDQRKSYFKVYTTGVVFNVLLNMVLAYYWQATGTAIAISITELFILTGLSREVLKLNAFKKQDIAHPAETIKTE